MVELRRKTRSQTAAELTGEAHAADDARPALPIDGAANDNATGNDGEEEGEGVLELSSSDDGLSDGSGELSEEDEEADDGDGREDLEEIQQALSSYIQSRHDHPDDDGGVEGGDADSWRAADDEADGSRDGADGGSDLGAPSTSGQESDSSEDERPSRNTVGNVPLVWYKTEPHIGYTRQGEKIIKSARRDKLDDFLTRADDAKSWRRVYDEYNDEEVELTKDEVDVIRRIREGRIPHAEVNPYEPYVDWFDWDGKGHPLSNAPEPKRRFIPSKWEAKQVVKLVRAMRKGWLKLDKPKEKPKIYLLWGDDLKAAQKAANGLTYIPAPKPKLPGHEESYNPPVEYLPTEEEVKSYQLMYEEDRPSFVPEKIDAFRKIPAYADFIKERFERCLDLYLCPRTRKTRININPESLIPKLPKPRDLRPFPTTEYLEYRGHTGAVCSISTDPGGEYFASGSHDGTVRLWEIQTARCRHVWDFGDAKVNNIAWCPNRQTPLLAVAMEKVVLLVGSGTGTVSEQATATALLQYTSQPKSLTSGKLGSTHWEAYGQGKGLQISHSEDVQSISWHHKGDYFATLAPKDILFNVELLLIHQLSKQLTQNPFKKNFGRVESVLFHPSRPFFFVATKSHVRVYNLAKQELAKKLLVGVNLISCMAIHPGGDNLIVGSKDMRLIWFDMDLSTKPYRTLRNHEQGLRAVAFHKTYPLFVSCSDDSTAHVFHGMVYSDLLQNPLIVPVKILRGHTMTRHQGVLDCVFHPTQPWLLTAGADSTIKLFCN
eukprot:SM000009S23600  [mRNA]  locus=s9:1013105:1019315:+ [translate_table: standard]